MSLLTASNLSRAPSAGLRKRCTPCALSAAAKLAAITASFSLLLSEGPAGADLESQRIPASSQPANFAAQRTVMEAWSIVQMNFIDADFGGNDWEERLGDALNTADSSSSREVAYSNIQGMMATLGDPYTRLVPPRDYADFKIGSEGKLEGVGMLIAVDKSSRKMVVLSPLRGGPAARAGVEPGDEVVSIDGHSVHGWDSDKAAHFLRGRCGSSVNIRLARRSGQVLGDAGRPQTSPYVEYRQVKLQREKLDFSPVYAALLSHNNCRIGYIRLASFSQKAAADVKLNVSELEAGGAQALILDLRSNPGGLVRSGLDIARLFIDGPATIFNIFGRGGSGAQPSMQKVVLEDGRAATHCPLVVLVDHESASASEILAGALKDNHRAKVIGVPTYGKGKIQSVFELEDGSAVFVTVARYTTPLFSEIDKIGVIPDASCKTGQQVPPGLPFDQEQTERMLQALSHDGCIIQAEESIDALLGNPPL